MNKLRHRRMPVALAALVVLFVLALPPARRLLESGMTQHMLVQFPLLAGCGFLVAGALPPSTYGRVVRWNAHGIAGLLANALVLGVLMIPRTLDLALVDPRVELAKWLALLVCGAALRLSWRSAGTLVQGFFLGNVLPMTVVAGQLYQDSPIRLCNAYLLDDQTLLGQWLVWVGVTVGCVWLGRQMVVATRAAG